MQYGTGNLEVDGVGNGRVGVRYGHHQITIQRPYQSFRVATLNVGTMRGRAGEVVETMSRRGVDVCCLQEVRWRGKGTRMVCGKDSRYKFFWSGSQSGTGGVGILINEKWTEKVIEVVRVTDRIMLLKMVIGDGIVTFISVYAPQAGLEDNIKDKFYDELREAVTKLGKSEIVFPCGDWNGHIGRSAMGYEGVHGGFGYGERNTEGERLLEYADATDSIICNSCFKKRDSHLVTFESGPYRSQIDFILVKKRDRRLVKNATIINGEECASQHKLLVCDLCLKAPTVTKQKFVPKLRVWKLKDPVVRNDFSTSLSEELVLGAEEATTTEGIWENLKKGLLAAGTKACGMSRRRRWRKEAWWWNEEVDAAIAEKRRCWKGWKKGGSKDPYLTAKRTARRKIWEAKQNAEASKFQDVDSNRDMIYRIVKQMRAENQDVLGDKCVKDDNGNLSFCDEAKKAAWKAHYERLLNREFDWNTDGLPPASPIAGPPICVTVEMVKSALSRMKSGKAPGPSGIVAEMLKASVDVCSPVIAELANSIIYNDTIPADWADSFIINCYKGKGGALDRGNYRGLKLMDQVMKVVERVLEKLVRERVNIDDMQFGFMPGRGTTDAIFILRQLQEKYLAKNRKLYLAFVDLEKAFDRVPRRVLWWAMRTLGLEEWIVRVVQVMYEGARSRVRINNTYSDPFDVKVGVHQGSVLSPLLFIIVLEALSQEFRTGCPWELLYADDLVIIAESQEELVVKIKLWKQHLEAKGLRVNMDKTKLMCSGPNLNRLLDSGRYPCGVCRQGVGRNSIYCPVCSHWIHKKCSGITGRISQDPNFVCSRCRGEARPICGRTTEYVAVDSHHVNVVDSFCYLGDTISGGGGCTEAAVARSRSGWGKFKEMLPVLTCKSLSLKTCGSSYNTFVHSSMFHGSECWAPKMEDIRRMKRNERSMLRWLCCLKPEDNKGLDSIYEELEIPSLEVSLQARRLSWYGHVQRSDGWIKRCTDMDIAGTAPRGRPRKTWSSTLRKDLSDCGLDPAAAGDRTVWKSSVRAAMNRLTH